MKVVVIGLMIRIIAYASGYAEDFASVIDQNVSPIARQLSEYSWNTSPTTNEAPEVVLEDAAGWVRQAVTEEFAPPSAVAPGIHVADAHTCDAVRVAYERNAYTISIAQTMWYMLVTIEGDGTRASSARAVDTAASRIAQRILKHAGEIQFRTEKVFDGCFLFEPKLSEELEFKHWELSKREQLFGLSKGWSDGKTLNFYGIKSYPVTNKVYWAGIKQQCLSITSIVAAVEASGDHIYFDGVIGNQKWFAWYSGKPQRMDRE